MAKRFSDFLFVSGAWFERGVLEPPSKAEIKRAYAQEVAERIADGHKSSPFAAVKWHKSSCRWVAKDCPGSFDDELEAAAAAQEEAFGQRF